jgi:hypothetical protein
MTMALTTEQSVIAGALVGAFHRWAGKHPRLKNLYKKIPRDYSVIIEAAFVEMHDISPGAFDLWWVKQHMRWGKRLCSDDKGRMLYREEHKRNIRQLMYHFLTDYCRGKLEH